MGQRFRNGVSGGAARGEAENRFWVPFLQTELIGTLLRNDCIFARQPVNTIYHDLSIF